MPPCAGALQLSGLHPVGCSSTAIHGVGSQLAADSDEYHAKLGALASDATISSALRLPPINALPCRRATCTCLTPSACMP